MKILEQKPPFHWTLECVCTGSINTGIGCQSRVEIDTGDLFPVTRHDDEGRRYGAFAFKCCNCNAVTDVPNSKIPQYIQDLMRG